MKRRGWLLLLLALLGSACATTRQDAATPAPQPTGTPTVVPFVWDEPLPSVAGAPTNPRVAPEPTHVPFRPLLPLDGIRPIYNPDFAAPADVAERLEDDELVIGVAWDGEAKAYPATVLRNREIVNDELAGIPILVTF